MANKINKFDIFFKLFLAYSTVYTNKNEAEHGTIIKCFLKINMFQVNEFVSQLTECRIKKFR